MLVPEGLMDDHGAARGAISCHISVFRLGAEPKAAQVLMSFRAESMQVT